MPVQWLVATYLSSPAQALNAVALFFALAGAFLWLATRWRERRLAARWLTETGAEAMNAEAVAAVSEPMQRINRFFYRFGAGCLALSLSLSWLSTTL